MTAVATPAPPSPNNRIAITVAKEEEAMFTKLLPMSMVVKAVS
ncbi:hypothetical protein SDC9_94889 [bioreactor metagenome]|uniref:Uncharacterized protein n=1 Tax=bioreactor metagenome TaxID=1076179 RepID=A0A645A5E8_9ZZZZ